MCLKQCVKCLNLVNSQTLPAEGVCLFRLAILYGVQGVAGVFMRR